MHYWSFWHIDSIMPNLKNPYLGFWEGPLEDFIRRSFCLLEEYLPPPHLLFGNVCTHVSESLGEFAHTPHLGFVQMSLLECKGNILSLPNIKILYHKE